MIQGQNELATRKFQICDKARKRWSNENPIAIRTGNTPE
jgi:hypothetical protein